MYGNASDGREDEVPQEIAILLKTLELWGTNQQLLIKGSFYQTLSESFYCVLMVLVIVSYEIVLTLIVITGAPF